MGLLLLLVFLGRTGVGFSQGVFCQFLDDVDHAGYWFDHYIVRVVFEGESRNCEHDTGEDCCVKLVLGFLFGLTFDIKSCIDD